MCGIAGLIEGRVSAELLNNMVFTLDNRGPDDKGVWLDSPNCIGLAHARLSIQDLSSAGHQPMISHSERFVMVFNGEIYNHLELRKQLSEASDMCWKSHSDTETLLAGFECWGVKHTLEKSVGMFAIAVWDTEQNQLLLARDRFGEKPLYYGW